jgi:hypothetical protein
MAYDPRMPHAERYVQNPPAYSKKLLRRVEQDALKLCRALGYDLNTVEFAVERGIPYAIDFMNPAPDADLHSVGAANFEWIVEKVADLAIAKAKAAPKKQKSKAKKKSKAAAAKPKKADKTAAVVESAAAVVPAETVEPVVVIETAPAEDETQPIDAAEALEEAIELKLMKTHKQRS